MTGIASHSAPAGATVGQAPLVSVIVPAFNAERFIEASLASVLAQTFDNYEVIVVDDGSTDRTGQVVRGVGGPVTYVWQANQGPAVARNTGIACARGRLICFLDADDCWVPDKLRTQVAFMDAHPDVGMVFADEDEFDERGVQVPSLFGTSRFHPAIASGVPIADAFRKLLQENFIPTSTVMARRECFEMAGVFDPALKGPEDRDMWSRIAARYSIAAIPRVLGRKRAVASSVSRNVETTLRSRIVMWTKASRLFPELAPGRTINALLAPTYLQLGFVLLNKGDTREARRLALKAVGVSRRPSEWIQGVGLGIFSLTGKRVTGVVFGLNRKLRSARLSSAGLA
jgi:glycosyltransferase involved in cell wall biosynthesis